jgi:hypothetical protein
LPSFIWAPTTRIPKTSTPPSCSLSRTW